MPDGPAISWLVWAHELYTQAQGERRPPWRLWWILEEVPLQEMHVGLLVTATTPTTASVNTALLWTWPSLTVSNRKHLEMACLFYMEINTFSLTSKC